MAYRSKKEFTIEELRCILDNENVDNVQVRINYADSFKESFLLKMEAGMKPTGIFREAGLPPELIGRKRIEKATYTWTGRRKRAEILHSDNSLNGKKQP
ncbi:MAG: hypothetical protein DBY08_00045 [Clostridiales bacterium]|nr:hypothetical protein [Bacillota bacterium]MEE0516595.1 hypothetical protein [Anaerovoracaceae bacterium]PWL95255.1 MAG: hypothetical protein DBY08_00045 [Clostridiales bacterium]